jgi:hypothetical protein
MTNVDRKTFEVFQRQAAERGMTLSGYAAELIGSGILGISSEEAEVRPDQAAWGEKNPGSLAPAGRGFDDPSDQREIININAMRNADARPKQ